ncbi:MAG TPA: nucleoside 2-deoxyribosyltransferase [Candidatus Paceibacterota bacterium]|jgi:nucleoside 2-deoxyribosyltransferase|nr:nucleoside 2-deoxyribosyltransferase [Candidatus Paceibacterota bacterium]
MKIYFAGSIRGGRDDREWYASIIKHLEQVHTVLTEHLGYESLTDSGEDLSVETIFARDMDWVRESDVIVSEVTNPSLGVGYELGQAEAMGKPILCLYREQEGKKLSAMLLGNSYPTIVIYATLEEAYAACDDFLRKYLTKAG